MPICRLNPVGAGLPAMAVCQSFHPARTLRHREASSLLQMPLCRLHPVGAGLPAMAVSQLFHPARTLRHREASSLLQIPPKPCGSWLASDGGVSVITSGNDIAPSRGKLAPTNAAYTLWELACQRWRCVSHFIRQGHCAIARQARSYTCQEQSLRLAHTPCLNVMIPGFLA